MVLCSNFAGRQIFLLRTGKLLFLRAVGLCLESLSVPGIGMAEFGPYSCRLAMCQGWQVCCRLIEKTVLKKIVLPTLKLDKNSFRWQNVLLLENLLKQT